MVARSMLAQFIRLRTVLSLQQAGPVLDPRSDRRRAGPIPGKKTLVLFSQGFVSPEVLDWQVQSTIDIANRANVAIYIIDSAGLKASAPTSGALVPATPLSGVSASTTQEERIRAIGGETVFDNVRQEGQSRSKTFFIVSPEIPAASFSKATTTSVWGWSGSIRRYSRATRSHIAALIKTLTAASAR